MKKYFLILAFVVVLLLAVSFSVNSRPSITSDDAERIRNDWGHDVLSASKYYSIPASRIFAIIGHESRGNQNAIGQAGEIGLMQILPSALNDVNKKYGSTFSSDSIRDGRQNVFAGTAYLRIMLDIFKNNLKKATRAYNAGASQVKWNPIAGYNYLLRVEANEKLFA